MHVYWWQVHREMLIRSLDQVKNLTPVLISGIKIFITARQTSMGRPLFIYTPRAKQFSKTITTEFANNNEFVVDVNEKFNLAF